MTIVEGIGAALAGIRVLEIGGGVAGAYCAKLLADMGAAVSRVEPEGGDPLAKSCLIRRSRRRVGFISTI